jgi:hypothetical protein
MKKIILLLIVLMMVSGGFLSGCMELNTGNGSDDGLTEYDRFIGTWRLTENITITFLSDGKCLFNLPESYWELKDGKLIISAHQGELEVLYDYYFSDDYTTLYLKVENYGEYTAYIKE